MTARRAAPPKHCRFAWSRRRRRRGRDICPGRYWRSSPRPAPSRSRKASAAASAMLQFLRAGRLQLRRIDAAQANARRRDRGRATDAPAPRKVSPSMVRTTSTGCRDGRDCRPAARSSRRPAPPGCRSQCGNGQFTHCRSGSIARRHDSEHEHPRQHRRKPAAPRRAADSEAPDRHLLVSNATFAQARAESGRSGKQPHRQLQKSEAMPLFSQSP